MKIKESPNTKYDPNDTQKQNPREKFFIDGNETCEKKEKRQESPNSQTHQNSPQNKVSRVHPIAVTQKILTYMLLLRSIITIKTIYPKY